MIEQKWSYGAFAIVEELDIDVFGKRAVLHPLVRRGWLFCFTAEALVVMDHNENINNL